MICNLRFVCSSKFLPCFLWWNWYTIWDFLIPKVVNFIGAHDLSSSESNIECVVFSLMIRRWSADRQWCAYYYCLIDNNVHLDSGKNTLALRKFRCRILKESGRLKVPVSSLKGCQSYQCSSFITRKLCLYSRSAGLHSGICQNSQSQT